MTETNRFLHREIGTKTAPVKVNNKKSLKKQRKKNKKNVKNLVFGLCNAIPHYFPDLFDRIRETEDCRKKKDYELAELVVAAVMMFVPKKESRNAFGNERGEEEFRQNYERISEVRFPRTDTADNVMRDPKERESERLKTVLVKNLLKKKTFHKYRMAGGYHRIAVGGTHVMTVSEGHCGNCPHRTSEIGKMTYFQNVPEARLVTGNGFSVSPGTERIGNPSGDYDKQDCEPQGKTVRRNHTWIGDLGYRGFPASRYECREQIGEETTEFVRPGSPEADYHTVTELTEAGRMRSNMENEGSDIRKNHGCNPGHKYPRVSMTAMGNYYQCMRIGHMINQLSGLSSLSGPLGK